MDYPSIIEPSQKLALLIDHQLEMYVTNLLMYVVFGVVLVVLVLALHERLHTGAPAVRRTAVVLGIIWAGTLIASGMVSNAGIAPVVALHGDDPAQAALTWLAVESVANGLGGASGEVLGGLFTFLVSLGALRAGALPKWLNYLGVSV